MGRWLPLLTLLTPLALAACTASEPGISFPSKSADGTPLRATLYRPEGPGPFPAVVQLHGCSGIGQLQEDWAKRFVSWGYVALVVDSLGPRGYQTVCGQGMAVSPALRARDAYGAADYLRGLPLVRADGIGVIGFSHGGWTVMRLVQSGQAEAAGSARFQAAVALYPSCNAAGDRQVAIPTLVLIGEQDDWTPASRCRELQPVLRQPELVQMVFYPNAHHAYDSTAPLRYVAGAGGVMHRLEPDREAAADSFARTRSWFDQHLKR